MRKSIILFALALISLTSHSQNAKLSTNGNYVAISHSRDTTKTATGKTFTDSKGNVYPVYLTATDRLFILRTSKAGNVYKQYLKL